MVTKKSVKAWEDAYRKYGAASEFAARAGQGDHEAASVMAHASWVVAEAWRAIAAERQDLTWWMLAAIESAAEAFEDQARHWQRKEGQDGAVQRDLGAWPGSGGGNACQWSGNPAGLRVPP